MEKEKKHAFILYQYNNFNNDLQYIKEYYSIKDLQEDQKIKLKNKYSIYNYIYKNINNKINNKLFNKYIIIKEDI